MSHQRNVMRQPEDPWRTPAGVVVLDPGRDRGPGLRPGREVLQAPQLELEGRVPRLDDGVIQRRQLRPITSLRSELCG
jgi:hypothetical protein